MKDAHRAQIAFTVDNKMRIQSWSKVMENIYGKSISEIKGMPYYEVIPGFSKSAIHVVKQAFKNGQPMKLKENMFLCVYGRNMADMHIIPLKDQNGSVRSARIRTKIHLNCTMMHKMEQQQKLTDIGRVAATLAHGVRNPLNAIKGAVTYIREKYSREGTLIEFTKIIEEEIVRLDKFIANFLSTSMSDEGFQRTNINTVLRKIATLTSLTARTHNIISVFEYGEIAPVMINPFHLEHAVLNVINNAIEAMSAGGRIKVKSRLVKHDSKEFSVIEISDSGPGMPQTKYNGITITSKTKSKGLGLFITTEILRSCSGHLEIKSTEGKGTTVKLYLPVIT